MKSSAITTKLIPSVLFAASLQLSPSVATASDATDSVRRWVKQEVVQCLRRANGGELLAIKEAHSTWVTAGYAISPEWNCKHTSIDVDEVVPTWVAPVGLSGWRDSAPRLFRVSLLASDGHERAYTWCLVDYEPHERHSDWAVAGCGLGDNWAP
jgi:hypothetical protein